MGSIIYFIGLVLAILAVLDIIKKPISLVGKIISCVLVLITSWVGLVVYYLYAKNHLTEWFKSEWLKEPASKTGVRLRVPGVRIPSSPQPIAAQR